MSHGSRNTRRRIRFRIRRPRGIHNRRGMCRVRMMVPMMVPMMVMMMMTMVTMVTMLLLSSILLRDSSSIHPFIVNAQSTTTSDDTSPIIIDTNDAPANLSEGQRLFRLHQYDAASHHLWRAVILHSQSNNSDLYAVDDAFTPFLRCYLYQNKILDGLVFVAAESYLRGQDNMGELYLEQALEKSVDDDGELFEGALELERVVKKEKKKGDIWRLRRIKEIRDRYDASSNTKQTQLSKDGILQTQFESNANTQHQQQQQETNNVSPQLASQYANKSPEDIYNIGTTYFNTKQYERASEIFELSCAKSDRRLSVACTNAVYLRTNICDWGYKGEGFERDMEIVVEVTLEEMRAFRTTVQADYGGNGEEVRRLAGMGYGNGNVEGGGGGEIIHWKRATSVHPHVRNV